MARTWTEAQSAAINEKNKTLLVSAAAGSGKTATLIERIIRMIVDKDSPADISRMLIVTFTKAAAGELRERIHAAITKAMAEDPGNRYLQKQMVMLESAKICTIHSFCLDLIKANFQRLSLSPSFRIADEAELALLYRSVMNDLIDQSFEAENDPRAISCGMDFAAFVDNFAGSRDDKNLCDIFISLYNKLSSYPEGVELLDDSANTLTCEEGTDFFATFHGNVVSSHLFFAMNYFHAVYREACNHFAEDELTAKRYSPSFEYDRDFIAGMLSALEKENYTAAREHYLSYSPVKLVTIFDKDLDDLDRLFKGVRKDFNDKFIKKVFPEIFAKDNASVIKDMNKTAQICKYLYRFMSEFEEKIEAEKKRRGICGFSDLERYALKLLYNGKEKSDLAVSVAQGYDYVYIDEYQDVNAVQDMIFRAVSNERNRFMVGDIKQSIYNFRGAESNIFSEYRTNFPNYFNSDKDAKNATIFMSDNFRCDKNIVDFVNLVSRATMPHSLISYLPEDDLCFKKTENTGEEKVKIWLFEKTFEQSKEDDEESVDSEITAESQAVAREIKRLITSEKKNDGSPIKASDIAIILQSVKKSGPAFMRALEAQGIATSSSVETDFFETPEILLMLCLLNTIDNPRRDIYLAGLLRSPLYGFTMDDLVALRDYDDGTKLSLFDMLCAYTEEKDFARGRYFLDKLKKYREMAEGMSVDRLIWALYRDTGALSLLSRDENSGKIMREKRDNLMFLYECARNFEASSYKGLYNFIKYINSVIEEGKTKSSVKMSTGGEDAVTLMTIHGSKGLEMPVCFVCDVSRPFNTSDLRSSLLFDYPLGVAMRLRDTTGFARYGTLARQAIVLHISQKLTEESMRTLYVALTRARERLYVTAGLRSDYHTAHLNAILRHAYPCVYTVRSSRSFLDWILPAIKKLDSDCFEFQLFDGIVEACEETDTVSSDSESIDEEKLKEAQRSISEKLDFRYPFADLPHIPAKVSVSRLYPDMLDPESKDAEEAFPTMKASPEFVSGSFSGKAAERGTATHIFMQFCDFDNLTEENVKEEIARLVEKKFISRDVAELVNINQLEKFAKSDFFARIKGAKTLYREFRFNIDLPASLFTANADAAQKLAFETVLVQGVIDCFFEEENGDIILCDYKTDHLTPEELADRTLATKKLSERHGEQLKYYKKAILKMCGKEPAHTYIYSLPLGDVIEL